MTFRHRPARPGGPDDAHLLQDGQLAVHASHLPERVQVRGGPVRQARQGGAAPGGQPRLPSSKYYTLRYILNASLAASESAVRGPALSDDTAVLLRAVQALGAHAQ